ncbi:MAG TPA: hypothetical protein VHC63_04090 [Acidimicrobiales bacterium]|nr:hypothetical protein [Acidimicrobiales bacterium]
MRRALVAITVLSAVALSVAVKPANASGPCTDDSRACVVSAAQSYLDALVSHNASKVRFASNVLRDENGVISGSGAKAMRHQLATSQEYKLITRLHDERWVAEGDEADAFYRIEASAVPGQDVHAATAYVAERFNVVHGLITRIDVVECFAGALTTEAAQERSVAPLVTDLCLRSGPKGL